MRRRSIVGLIGDLALAAGCHLFNPDGSTVAVTYRSRAPFTDPAFVRLDVEWPGGNESAVGTTPPGRPLAARPQPDVAA